MQWELGVWGQGTEASASASPQGAPSSAGATVVAVPFPTGWMSDCVEGCFVVCFFIQGQLLAIIIFS